MLGFVCGFVVCLLFIFFIIGMVSYQADKREEKEENQRILRYKTCTICKINPARITFLDLQKTNESAPDDFWLCDECYNSGWKRAGIGWEKVNARI